MTVFPTPLSELTGAEYSIANLDLFPAYADRAAYLSATGNQAPPFNAALPIKPWEDPNASATLPMVYSIFDAGANPPGAVTLTVPAAAVRVNLPGAYVYSAYVQTPTDAELMGPFGFLGLINPDTVCLQAAAQALANIFTTLYGKTVSVVDSTTTGELYVVYGNDPRRQWGLQVLNGVFLGYAQSYITAQNIDGAGAPGSWSLASNNGTPPTLLPTWTQTPQTTVAPPNAVTLPVPIRALLPTESFVNAGAVSGSPLENAQWLVANSANIPAPPPVVTLAQVQALVAQYNAQSGVTAISIQ
jgi:hypothetical protein